MNKRKLNSNQSSPIIPRKQVKMPSNELSIQSAIELLEKFEPLENHELKSQTVMTIKLLLNDLNQLKELLEAKDRTLTAKDEIINGRDEVILAKDRYIELMQTQQQQIKDIIEAPKLAEHRRSIVVQNMKESDLKCTEESIEADKNQVKDLIKDIGAYANIVAVYRMGAKDEKKNRLVKVQLQTSSQARDVLGNAKNLNGLKKYSGISLRKSLTNEERMIQHHQFEAMKNRIEELKPNHPNLKFCIYRNKICIKQLDGSPPTVFQNEPMNQSNPIVSGANAVQLNQRRINQFPTDESM